MIFNLKSVFRSFVRFGVCTCCTSEAIISCCASVLVPVSVPVRALGVCRCMCIIVDRFEWWNKGKCPWINCIRVRFYSLSFLFRSFDLSTIHIYRLFSVARSNSDDSDSCYPFISHSWINANNNVIYNTCIILQWRCGTHHMARRREKTSFFPFHRAYFSHAHAI